MNQFSLDAYQYVVPKNQIAQHPIEPRDHARLLIVNRKTGEIDEARVLDLAAFLEVGDGIILNNTRVLHCALTGELASGGKIQSVLTKQHTPRKWTVLAKPAKKLGEGKTIFFANGITAVVTSIGDRGEREVLFSQDVTPQLLDSIGAVPLPPYIQRKADGVDVDRYQTIYAQHHGSSAAPTAGLHFTDRLFENLSKKGISRHEVTLHVGMGTFTPIYTDDIRDHHMHTESFTVSEETARGLSQLTQRRVAIGTTSCRVLESIADEEGRIQAKQGETDKFIYPGYTFKYVNTLFTNFHTPGSSLLVLVSAFMGYDLWKEAYAKAIEKKFRLFSYGDAMLIL